MQCILRKFVSLFMCHVSIFVEGIFLFSLYAECYMCEFCKQKLLKCAYSFCSKLEIKQLKEQYILEIFKKAISLILLI